MDDIGLWLIIIGTVVTLFLLSFIFSRNSIKSGKKKRVVFSFIFWVIVSVAMALSLLIFKDIGWGILLYLYFGIYGIVPSIIGLIIGSVAGLAKKEASKKNTSDIKMLTLVGITALFSIAFSVATIIVPYSEYLVLPCTFLAPIVYLKKYKLQSWKSTIVYSFIATIIVITIFVILGLLINFIV